MTKMLLLILSLPAFLIFINAVCAINSMSIDTKEVIRLSNILIALGAGLEIMALCAVYSVDYGAWISIKMMFSGAIIMNFGYSGLFLANRRRKCGEMNNGH